jgi:hypothetical protein
MAVRLISLLFNPVQKPIQSTREGFIKNNSEETDLHRRNAEEKRGTVCILTGLCKAYDR